MSTPPGYTIQELMDDHNISFNEMALKLDVTDEQLHKLLKGKARLSKRIIRKLVDVFGIPFNFWNRYELLYWRK